MSNSKLVIVTPSYRRDLERCRLTVRSVDRFVDPDLHHYLVIDRRDVAMFREFENDRTTIITAEDLLPWWIFRIPRVRKVWMSVKTLPVRSWIVQQLMKLSVASQIDADVFCFVDSDVAFVRPTGLDAFVSGDQVRLFRRPGHANMATHQRWHRSSARLLGLEERDYFGADFIGNMITWRRDTLLAMQKHIEQVTGKHWVRAVASEMHLSEYILYGIFAEHVAGFEQAGHAPQDFDLCHCSWDYKIDGQDDIDTFFNRDLDPHIRAVLVQSNLGLSADAYAQRVELLQDQLNTQPAA